MVFNKKRLLIMMVFGLLMLLLTHSSTDKEVVTGSTSMEISQVVVK